MSPSKTVDHFARHELGGAYARESFLFDVKLPEEGLAGLVYTWVNADDEAGCAAWIYRVGEAGGTVFEVQDKVPVDSTQDFDDWRVGPLAISLGPGNRGTKVAYRSERIGIEFDFEPMHEACLYSRTPAGCPQYFATDRMEQSGTVTGHLRIDNRQVDFQTQGHHDHSWGTRDWGAVQHYKWIEAQAEDTSVHVFELNAYGERPLIGYVYRDGTYSHVVGADWDVTYDERQFQRRLRVDIHDESGRTTTMTGQTYAEFAFPVSPEALLLDTMMDVDIAGRRGAAFVDFLWPPAYIDHITPVAANRSET